MPPTQNTGLTPKALLISRVTSIFLKNLKKGKLKSETPKNKDYEIVKNIEKMVSYLECCRFSNLFFTALKPDYTIFLEKKTEEFVRVDIRNGRISQEIL